MNMIKIKKIIIAQHYGFCMGVKRAISIAEKTMTGDEPVTILNEIVHNDAIVQKFSKSGVGQSSDIDEITRGTVIISAHGASPEVITKGRKRGLKIVDATCPLVIRIHKIIRRLAENDYHILHFGDPDHDETIGIVGHAPGKVTVIQSLESLKKAGDFEGKLALTSQTTARIADFEEVERAARKLYPGIEVFNTICNATGQRQAAIVALAPEVDLMLVVGSQTSANSKRLAKISATICPRSFLINSANDIRPEMFTGNEHPVETVGLSAGASTPDFLIDGVKDRLIDMAGRRVDIVYSGQRCRVNELVMKKMPFDLNG
nr:4-hydroxy-3-methylbut-2-enyl diphosphate reductase [candidate division Zixibacteria bacterium]